MSHRQPIVRRREPARTIAVPVARAGSRGISGRGLAILLALGAFVEWALTLAAAGYLPR